MKHPRISFRVAIVTMVVGLSEREGVPVVMVSFTGVGWDTRERIDALARSTGGPSRSEPRARSSRRAT